jgi:hypothetical protein
MKQKYNPYYANCKHFKWLYPNSTYIGNSHSRVIAYCYYFKIDIFAVKRTDDVSMCCISQSPYAKKNCPHFRNKSGQTMLTKQQTFGSDKQ